LVKAGNLETRSKSSGLSTMFLVLGSVSRLSGGRRWHAPTMKDIREDLRDRYGETFTPEWIRHRIAELEKMNLVTRQKGSLRDGRETIFLTTRGETVTLTMIRLEGDRAFVHDGWEGIIHDPPKPTEDKSGSHGSIDRDAPTSMVEWNPLDYALPALGAASPIIFVLGVIGANELWKS